MPLFDRAKNAIEALRGGAPKGSIRENMGGYKPPEGKIDPPAPEMPPGINFSALWEDQADQSILPLIISGLAAFLAGLGLFVHF